MDDLSRLSKHNDNNKYLLTCIDVFFKKLPLKSKSGPALTETFSKLLDDDGHPAHLQTHKFTDFLNTTFNLY